MEEAIAECALVKRAVQRLLQTVGYGDSALVDTHLANDWLAACWVFFWGSLLSILACLYLLAWANFEQSGHEIFIWSSG